MSANYIVSRFRIEDGPAELFERVEVVMCTKGAFRLNRERLESLLGNREALLAELESINLLRWDLVEAGVRMDTGKFVSSSWEKTIGDQRWRIVIGLYDQLLSIEVASNNASRSRRNDSADARWVADVNRKLMEKERGDPKTHPSEKLPTKIKPLSRKAERVHTKPVKQSYQKRILAKVRRAKVRSDKIVVSKETYRKVVTAKPTSSPPPASRAGPKFRYTAGPQSAQNDDSAEFPDARWV